MQLITPGSTNNYCDKHNCEKYHTTITVKDKLRHRWTCKQCKLEYDTEYRKKNKEKRKSQQKEYYEEHKPAILAYQKEYGQENKIHISEQKKEYRTKHRESKRKKDQKYYFSHREERLKCVKRYASNNKNALKKYHKKYYRSNVQNFLEASRKNYRENKPKRIIYARKYQKQRRLLDPIFKLRGNISCSIKRALRAVGSSKQGKSIMQYLPYSIIALKTHLEQQFEPWMNWQNWGVYNISTWNDNDPSTWTWQIDHIIPHSIFQYSSMEEEAFQQCWALTNLRPYSAKQNVIDGNRLSLDAFSWTKDKIYGE